MSNELPPWLTQDEIDDLCRPLKQSAAQIRFLRAMGLTVREKPNGTPLVMRANVEQVLNPGDKKDSAPKRGPNRAALIATFARG